MYSYGSNCLKCGYSPINCICKTKKMNITKESQEIKKKKKSKEYDAYFYTLVEKVGEFDEKSRVLYLKKDTKSDNEYLLTLMENYKFMFSKSLF